MIPLVKVSKAGKARLKRATQAERKAIHKAARLLADYDLITSKRHVAILRVTVSHLR